MFCQDNTTQRLKQHAQKNEPIRVKVMRQRGKIMTLLLAVGDQRDDFYLYVIMSLMFFQSDIFSSHGGDPVWYVILSLALHLGQDHKPWKAARKA